MNIAFDGFDWDDGNAEKCRKHGVSIGEVEIIFRELPIILPDFEHSQAEERFHCVGQNEEGRFVFIVFTIRQKDGRRLLRPISARYMHQKEIKRYEETKTA